jgi:hypothetical protein
MQPCPACSFDINLALVNQIQTLFLKLMRNPASSICYELFLENIDKNSASGTGGQTLFVLRTVQNM